MSNSLDTLDERIQEAHDSSDTAALQGLYLNRLEAIDAAIREAGTATGESLDPAEALTVASLAEAVVSWLDDRQREEGSPSFSTAQLAAVGSAVVTYLTKEPLLAKMARAWDAEYDAFNKAPADGVTGRALDQALEQISPYLREAW